jgi:hypothetical protein
MAHDIFHHHDGVVHQDADGKDQGEQGDAIQSVAVEVEDGEGQRQGDGNGDEHDERFAQPQRDGDQQADRNHGDEHVPQEFVGFVGGGIAVIPGDDYVHAGRNHSAF